MITRLRQALVTWWRQHVGYQVSCVCGWRIGWYYGEFRWYLTVGEGWLHELDCAGGTL